MIRKKKQVKSREIQFAKLGSWPDLLLAWAVFKQRVEGREWFDEHNLKVTKAIVEELVQRIRKDRGR
jgi:hypothetical protein